MKMKELLTKHRTTLIMFSVCFIISSLLCTGSWAATTDKASWVSETISDNTKMTGGSSFNKTWTIKNSGTSTWTSSYKLKYASNQGGRLSSTSEVKISGSISPGKTYTFTVPMKAPAAQTSEKTYREDWKFTNASGSTISVGSSSTIWALIKVPAMVSAVPEITSFTGGTRWGHYLPYTFEGYFKVAYEGYSNANFRITVKGKNLDKVTKVTILESNPQYKYRETVTIYKNSSSQFDIEIFALTNNYSDTKPSFATNPSLRFYYNDGSEKYILNDKVPLAGILPTYNDAGQSWGQCTWYAGYIKMLQNGRTPCKGFGDGFSSLNGDPINSGFPKKGVILNCSGSHMAYVVPERKPHICEIC
jgi:Ig-like domain from next to BRCA1 gene